MPKRYKIHRTPPQTEKEKRIAHQKQRINQADKSYLHEARVLVPASLIAVLIPGLLGWLVGQLPLWAQGTLLTRLGVELLGLGRAVLLAPITLLGFSGLCLKVWRGRKCRLADLFACCRPGRLGAAWAFSALYIALTALPWIATGLLPTADLDNGITAPVVLGIAVGLVLWGLALWLYLRLLPAPLLHLLEPGPPLMTLRAAWGLTAGQVGGMARFGLRLLLRAGVGLVLYLLLMVLFIVLPLTGAALTVLATVAQYLMLALATPLVCIGAIGYVDAWLPSDSQVRKKNGQTDAQ